MKHILFTAATVFALSLMTTSCSSDDDNGPAGEGPAIEIITPVPSAEYAFGDTVFIQVQLEHSEEIGDFHIEMIDQNTDHAVIDQMDQTDGSSLTIEGSWVNDVQNHTEFELTVTATDNWGRISMESVSFHCHPEQE